MSRDYSLHIRVYTCTIKTSRGGQKPIIKLLIVLARRVLIHRIEAYPVSAPLY